MSLETYKQEENLFFLAPLLDDEFDNFDELDEKTRINQMEEETFDLITHI